MEQAHGIRQGEAPLQVQRHIPQAMMGLGPPLFSLTGLAIGNGLTDPQLQVSPLNKTSKIKAGIRGACNREAT